MSWAAAYRQHVKQRERHPAEPQEKAAVQRRELGDVHAWVVANSCLTLCDPLDCSLTVSSVHGIFRVRILEWVAIFLFRGSSQPQD